VHPTSSEPAWLVPEPFEDVVLGPLKSGKEAEIFVVERTGDDRSCLLAHKRYRPRFVRSKGELEALGFQHVASFVNDAAYRDMRRVGNTRDQRAIARRSRHGRRVLQEDWAGHELDVLRRLWDAGATVPYPVAATADGLLMQYLGDLTSAAPPLARARLGAAEVTDAYGQLVDNLRTLVAAGVVHADLSAYNLLWWEGRLWVIDLPQAVDVGASPMALDLLHRDVSNVCRWFGRKGIECDADVVFAELLAHL
jgi:RIO kinase 1